jgi:hypothetical protein
MTYGTYRAVPTDLEMLYKSCRANGWGQPVEIGLDPDQGIQQWSPEKEKKNQKFLFEELFGGFK